MTAFRYAAARADGARVTGEVDALSRDAAAALLSARGLFPLRVDPRPAGAGVPWWRRPSVRDRATALQSLATLVGAGVPLERALAATVQVTIGPVAEALARVRTKVREGAALATALAAEPAVANGVTVGLIRAGERGVGLEAALAQAAAELEREAEAVARIRAALAYPVLLAVMGTISVAVIVLFVVPRFAAILGDLGQALPPATRILIAVSGFARHDAWILAAGFAATAVALGPELARHRLAVHRLLLDMPVVGSLRHALATARVTRTLAALLETGTPALAALAIAAESAGDEAVAERLAEARAAVAEGRALTMALDRARALTPAALPLVAIGEQSGRLAPLLAKAAAIESQRAERALRGLVGLLEPALIIAFAGVVAFVAAALLQAVYSVRPG